MPLRTIAVVIHTDVKDDQIGEVGAVEAELRELAETLVNLVRFTPHEAYVDDEYADEGE